MTTRNPIAIVASQLPGRRALTILATALLAASFVSAGCNDNNTNKDRGRRPGSSSSTTIKCGNATCNTATQKCENGACVPKNGATTIPCGSTTCDATTQKCENGACVPKNGAATIPCGSTTCDATTQKCESDACVLKPGFTQCGQSVCNDSTHSCENSQCVSKSIACGSGTCDRATQECKSNKCVIKGATDAGCDPAYQKEVSGRCVTNNEGDGTCSGSPCTGDTVCQGRECVSICKFCDESANYVGCFSGLLHCKYNEASKKYMAENESTGTQVECANPACGQKTAPDASGHTPCWIESGGQSGDCDLDDGYVCANIGGQYTCAKAPKQQSTQPESPCGQACGSGKVCNATTKQCETNSSAHGSCTAPPNVTRLSFTPDATPGQSYRSTATVNTTIGRHSATVGGFEAAMNTCGDAQTSNTDYQVFLIHLDTYSNISVYSNTTSDEPFDKFSLALLNATECSSYLVCEKDFRISKGRSLEQGPAKTLPAGDYYLIVKNNDVSNTAAQGKSWNLRVVKETYTTEGECTGPEQSGATYSCDSNKKAYTTKCQTNTITPPSFAPEKITCLTTNDSHTTTQGCYQESSSTPSCYGVTCNKPIVVDGSTKRTITFTDVTAAKKSTSANYTSSTPSFTNSTCTPTPQPSNLVFTYVLKITNLQADSKVTVRFPPTGTNPTIPGTPILTSSSAVVRFQSSCGTGDTCLSAQSFTMTDDSSLTPNTKELSYPQKTSDSMPTTLYLTVSVNTFPVFPFGTNAGFDLIIAEK